MHAFVLLFMRSLQNVFYSPLYEWRRTPFKRRYFSPKSDCSPSLRTGRVLGVGMREKYSLSNPCFKTCLPRLLSGAKGWGVRFNNKCSRYFAHIDALIWCCVHLARIQHRIRIDSVQVRSPRPVSVRMDDRQGDPVRWPNGVVNRLPASPESGTGAILHTRSNLRRLDDIVNSGSCC